MPWPEDALSEGESIVTDFRPHWKLLFIPFLWFVAILLAIAVILGGFGWSGPLGIALTIVGIGALLWLVVRPLVTWWFTRYVLTTQRLITRTGLVAQSGVEIPLERITNVNFSQSVFERMLGAGDLLIESAGSSGRSSFANIPQPDDFQRTLYKVRELRSQELAERERPSDETAPPAASGDRDAGQALRDLAQLRDDGLVTEEEYEAKRKELLEDL